MMIWYEDLIDLWHELCNPHCRNVVQIAARLLGEVMHLRQRCAALEKELAQRQECERGERRVA